MCTVVLLKANGTGQCGQIFKIAQVVQSPKKPGPEAHYVKDPKSGKLQKKSKIFSSTTVKKFNNAIK